MDRNRLIRAADGDVPGRARRARPVAQPRPAGAGERPARAGVGLDVVKRQLEQLHGTLDLASKPGQGLRFTLAVPLTLTTLRALLASAKGEGRSVPIS